MKKTIALLIVLVLSLALLVACNTPDATKQKLRWNNGETLTYKISLADFSDKGGGISKDILATNVGESDPTLPMENNSHDRIAPKSVDGTYTINFTLENGSWTVKTQQVLLSTYYTEDLTLDFSNEEFAPYLVSIDTENNTTTVTSTTKTEVKFKDNLNQTPEYSKTEVDGLYIGKENQSVSKYVVETHYEQIKNGFNAKVTINGGDEVVNKVKEENLIDLNQVLVYTRGFDKKDGGFADSPSIVIYNPFKNQTNTATFAYAYQQKTTVSKGEDLLIADKLSRLDVLVDGLHYMTQLNLPDLSKHSLDVLSSGDGSDLFPKHTTFRFRVGFLSYELQGVSNEIIDLIKEQPAE